MKTCRRGLHSYEDGLRRCPECLHAWRHSPEQEAKDKAYRKSSEGRAAARARQQKYDQSEKGQVKKREYRQEHSELYRYHQGTYRKRYPWRRVLYEAKIRAESEGVPFDLQESDILTPERCPLLDIPLFRQKGRPGPNTPSLDRIVPKLGYVRGNVWVISYRANMIKSDASLEELESLIDRLRHKIKGY